MLIIYLEYNKLELHYFNNTNLSRAPHEHRLWRLNIVADPGGGGGVAIGASKF